MPLHFSHYAAILFSSDELIKIWFVDNTHIISNECRPVRMFCGITLCVHTQERCIESVRVVYNAMFVQTQPLCDSPLLQLLDLYARQLIVSSDEAVVQPMCNPYCHLNKEHS